VFNSNSSWPVYSSHNTLWVKSCKLHVTIIRADVASVCYWFPYLFLFFLSLFTVTHKASSGWLHLTALQYTHTPASQSHGHKNISSHSSLCHAAHISIIQRGKQYCFSFSPLTAFVNSIRSTLSLAKRCKHETVWSISNRLFENRLCNICFYKHWCI